MRAKMAISTQELFDAEVQKLRSIFWSNGLLVTQNNSLKSLARIQEC